jgi:hypothetical protein
MQKQPAQQGFKTGGQAIGRRITLAGAPTGPIAAATDKVTLRLPQHILEALQGLGLGVGAHCSDHLAMQGMGAGWGAAAAQALVEFPHRIP